MKDGPILVTGATGFLGRHLLEALLSDDDRAQLVALVRDAHKWQSYDWTQALDSVKIVHGSVTEPAAWADDVRLEGLSGIYHLAAVVRHSRRDPHEIYETNVDGTLNMVRLAATHGCRIVFVSTSGTVACFRSPDAWADENSPYCEEASVWPYYHSKIRAEREAMQLARDLAVQLVIIRLPVLLGPGDHRFRSTGHILRFLRRKLPFLIRGGIHFVDVRDAAQALLQAMERPEPRPVYHLSGTACSIHEFFKMVQEVSGVPAPRLTVPFRPAWLLATAVERLGVLLTGSPPQILPDPVVIEMASKYWDARSLYAADELGYVCRNPRETLADTVTWLRQNHEGLS